ncbi:MULTISPECIES: FAD-dependent oxidoreductase [unclassified Crossiella]|uniref:FAD-dependent oxidoreductase n=1 Tax=unclassified Crossiella TaxID=2620835 RepID=UPI001FFE67AD|nr:MULTISPECIES: FAD-binding protein [unclassified Crossiella]MCK2239439.1 FAD-binding protein [Crossiella sp. S99.2]MCK2252134.1 FAD-binding protein [Crossiella sp. S99.1]
MNDVSRRGFLAGAAAVGGLAATGGVAAAAPAAEASGGHPPLGPVTVRPGDPRYEDLRIKGINVRFRPTPEAFQLVGSTDQVVRAVQEAVRAGKRITVRGGGHSCEDFVGDGAQVIIDLSQFHDVYFDPRRNAFAIEAGATLREVYKTLYLGWGVTVPGGECGEVGVGGHIQGGGYGPQSRKLGVLVDYLYAVEVVVVDKDGTARAVVATREPHDPNRDLWWAHTGGGGGNFGVVTRYWMRDPKAKGTDPTKLLPKPAAAVLAGVALGGWAEIDETRFVRLMRNYGEFMERHKGADSPYASLWSAFLVPCPTEGAHQGGFVITGQLDATVPNADKLLADYFAAVTAGVDKGVHVLPPERRTWLTSALSSGTNQESGRYKQKSAYLRKRYTDEQAKIAYRHITKAKAPEGTSPPPMLWLLSFGGKVNTVAPEATAMPQRDSILKATFITYWPDPAEEALEIRRVREFFRDLYADTGGVPVPNAANDGCYINYPDIDMADPAWNTSGVPWHELFYKGNYPKLQQVKAKWDPRNVFHHALSIRLP